MFVVHTATMAGACPTYSWLKAASITFCRVSFFWMTTNRHSCLFFADGARRAASRIRSI